MSGRPNPNSLMSHLRDILDRLEIGQEEAYPKDNCNFITLRNTYYQLKTNTKEMRGKTFESRSDEDLFYIKRTA